MFTTALNLPSLLGTEKHGNDDTQAAFKNASVNNTNENSSTVLSLTNKSSRVKETTNTIKKTKASIKKIPPLSSSKNISKISVKQPERTDYFYTVKIE